MKYRAEIDGLRAVAVLPVILFHAGFNLFSGGFVGVDIFFVISGYLITTILAAEIDGGRFSIVNFYERRARRILPALFLVILCCIPFAWMWMLPGQFEQFAASVAAVGLFVSNILFWQESGYFQSAAIEKPLLHTWSLAVEEQYYLFFPIFLFFAWKLGKNRAFWIIVVLAGLSLALSEVGWRLKPDANFYLAPSRVWELFAGSIAAFVVREHGIRKNQTLAAIGLAAIAVSIFFFDETTPFPSLYALVPVVGVALIIMFGRSDTWAARLLSNRALVAIGLISYSAYLWHQPLFAFARIRSASEPSSYFLGVLGLLSLGLAALSWKFVEVPFRDRKKITRRTIFSLSLAGIALSIAFGVAGSMNGFESRFTKDQIRLSRFQEREENLRSESCKPIKGFGQRERCILGNADHLVGALVGDSHAHMLWPSLGRDLERAGLGMITITDSPCPPILNIYRRDQMLDCGKRNREIFEFLKARPDLEYVVISGRWTLQLEGTRFDNHEGGVEDGNKVFVDIERNGVREVNDEQTRMKKVLAEIEPSFRELTDAGKKLFVVYPVPEVGFAPNERFLKNQYLRQAAPLDHGYDRYLERNRKVRTLFDEIRSKDPGIEFADVSRDLCDQSTRRCKTIKETGDILYFDDDHLSSAGGELISSKVIQWLAHKTAGK